MSLIHGDARPIWPGLTISAGRFARTASLTAFCLLKRARSQLSTNGLPMIPSG